MSSSVFQDRELTRTMDESLIEFVTALYPYTGSDQPVPLPFAASTVLQVVERSQNGWCRGFSAGKEGWFPISYVKPLANSELIQVGSTVRAQLEDKSSKGNRLIRVCALCIIYVCR